MQLSFQFGNRIYELTGKMESPSEKWIHPTVALINYELFVMTEGTLYISHDTEDLEVNPGEYLLLPHKEAPHNIRSGYRPSLCSFYWMHFLSPEPLCMQQLDDEEFSHCQAALLDDRILIPLVQEFFQTRNNYCPDETAAGFCSQQFSIHGSKLWNDHYSLFLNAQLQKAANIKSPANPKNDQRQIYADIIDYVKPTLMYLSKRILPDILL